MSWWVVLVGDEERFGKYRIEELLGRGGMGEVHRVFDTEHERYVALKRLLASTTDASFADRFRRESRIVARLRNAHVIPIHAFGEIDGQLYLDMRLVDGADLGRIVAHGPLAPERAVAILTQVAAALDEAHAEGLVHRDVKSSNVLVDADDFAYLTDFGIARWTADPATALTMTGAIIGSLDYIAPERLASGAVDARTDVYSLACLLFECLTGRPPFPNGEIATKIAAHLHQPPPAVSAVRPGVTSALDAVVGTGMAKDPAQRYGRASELMAEASAALSATSQVAPPSAAQVTTPVMSQLGSSAGPPPARSRQRGRVVGAVVAALAVVAVAVGALVGWRSGWFGVGSGTATSTVTPRTSPGADDEQVVTQVAADLADAFKPWDAAAVLSLSCPSLGYQQQDLDETGFWLAFLLGEVTEVVFEVGDRAIVDGKQAEIPIRWLEDGGETGTFTVFLIKEADGGWCVEDMK